MNDNYYVFIQVVTFPTVVTILFNAAPHSTSGIG